MLNYVVVFFIRNIKLLNYSLAEEELGDLLLHGESDLTV